MEGLEPNKESLEIEKLRLEIETLRKSWWIRPTYIAAVSPIVIAALTFLAAWLSGYFSTERANLKNEIAELTVQQELLERRIAEIRLANDRLDRAADAIVETRSITGSTKNPQQAIALAEFNDALNDLIHLLTHKPQEENQR